MLFFGQEQLHNKRDLLAPNYECYVRCYVMLVFSVFVRWEMSQKRKKKKKDECVM